MTINVKSYYKNKETNKYKLLSSINYTSDDFMQSIFANEIKRLFLNSTLISMTLEWTSDIKHKLTKLQ